MSLFWLLAGLLGGADEDSECLVLGGLDVVRTEAFVSGEGARLRDVYVDERATRADTAVLRSYRERGLRLEGLLILRESCRVTDRSSHRLVLDVVDRLGPSRAHTDGGGTRELPLDRPTRRTVVLDQTRDGWRVAAVR